MKGKPRLGQRLFAATTKNKKFYVNLYSSGIQQVDAVAKRKVSWSQAIKERAQPRIYLERHIPRKTAQRHKDATNRRRKWALVQRDNWTDDRRFAPIYAGPFESLELALLAWELMS